MCEQERCVETLGHHNSQPPRSPQMKLGSKSDVNFLPTPPFISQNSHLDVTLSAVRSFRSCTEDYYKKYAHDTVPVKDSDKSCSISKGCSLTNSELDDLEKRLCTNVSPDMQTDENSSVSLDSNIKLIKLTVEKIFENFFDSMSDFEHYKKRFDDLIAQSKGGYHVDMEEFIHDMFEHIQSSDNSIPSISGAHAAADSDACGSGGGDSLSTDQEQGKGMEETYHNENYLTDSTQADTGPILKRNFRKDDIFNIFMLADTPRVEIKLNGRNLLSEIHIRHTNKNATTEPSASVGNLKRLAAKQLESEKSMEKSHNYDSEDRDIPIKISCAKKNIHLNEDFTDNDYAPKSFLCRFCKVMCKKFRRNIIG